MSKIDDGGFVYPGCDDNVGQEGITRRDDLIARIAVSMAHEIYDAELSIEDKIIGHVVRISSNLADAIIAEGRKEAE